MLEINTGQLRNRKKVLIDGHEYTVRKLGAGEELQIGQMAREMERIQKKKDKITEKDTDRGVDIANKIFDIMVSTFDDGVGGEKSKALVSGLSQEELKELYAAIFDEPKTETPAVEADNGSTEA